ncbi:MAG: 50S ribosomal protein L23 [Parcubacteria group bacterium]
MALFGKKTKEPVKKEESAPAKSASASPELRRDKEKKAGLAWNILKKAHITEKATDSAVKNKYIFNVYPETNKNQIKKSVEDIYGVNVMSVNIIKTHPKKRKLGKSQGWKSGFKKAIVTIKSGQEIELMPK